MKISELFKTPFKLKGGSILNLKGFSKRVVDKEIGGENSNFIFTDLFIKTFNAVEPSKYLYCNNGNIYTIDDFINKAPGISDERDYYFFYKKSDFDNFSNKTILAKYITGYISYIEICRKDQIDDAEIHNETINGEVYVNFGG